MKRAMLEELLAARDASQSTVMVTRLADGRQALWRPEQEPADEWGATLAEACAEAVRQGKSQVIERGDERYFLQVHDPPKRLFIVGAVHISQFLAPMASMAEYAVTVVDPRDAWATPERFPGIPLLRAWPDDALRQTAPDGRSAVVTLSHDPKLDDPALELAIRSPAFYVGALGSRRTHARRVERLTEKGFSEHEIGRIHAPIGLDLGAVSPCEIAVSILAQLTEALRGPRWAKGA